MHRLARWANVRLEGRRRAGAMNSGCSQDDAYGRAVAAYEEAARRDPRRFRCGYLAGEPASGACAAFVWFATPAELIAFVSTVEVALLRFDADDAARLRAKVERVFARTRDLGRVDRDVLTAAFEGWCEILWIGTFSDLCERGGPFTTALRRTFRQAHDLGDHAGPITEEECDAFLAFLGRTGADGGA